jgi:hypothetical protein
MPTPLPPHIDKPTPKPQPTLQEQRLRWIHEGHDRLTENMEHFTKKSKVWGKVLLLGTGLAAFLVWTSMVLGLQRDPFNILTIVIWLGSVYIVYRIRTIH